MFLGETRGRPVYLGKHVDLTQMAMGEAEEWRQGE